ncbi:hypothetical protein [Marinobacterium stanieri]|uniref:DUF7220 family protein n=1 Tax=Marinobacterium stanieri TaxID=49186 RepID=UPI003A94AF51
MEQTKLGSFIEALINVVIGFAINYTANMTLFPLFGWEISMEQNIGLGLCYTAISVARSYTIRRYFNGRIKAASQALAKEMRL